MLRQLTKTMLCFMLLAASLAAQETFTKKVPSVTMYPAEVTSVTRGRANGVDLRFRVEPGFHINSNKPAAEYLIPTTLRLDPPTDIIVGGVTYPPGQEASFAFAPNEKLSVYTGNFYLSVNIRPMANVLPSKYELHGQLRYQACDNAACYPPKNLPVRFEVKVVKSPPPPRKNPAQSPHVHN